MEKFLQNPVWYSLEQSHKKWQMDFDGVKFYDPEICPFGAFQEGTSTTNAVNEYAKLTDKFFLVTGDEPTWDEQYIQLIQKKNGVQMVLNELVDKEITEEIILLTPDYMDEIYELIWKVMPGYYRKRSYEMGSYWGIKKEGRLVSIAGQRMQTDAFIEISGVVTDPAFTKRGYAGQLVVHNARQIIKSGKHPILHTTQHNPAIKLYERLGFELTRPMNWWYFTSK